MEMKIAKTESMAHTFNKSISETMHFETAAIDSKIIINSFAENSSETAVVEPAYQLFSCNKCFKTFTTKAKLKQHRRIHTGEGVFPCTSCDKTFHKKRYLDIHQRIHSGIRPYVCNVCRKPFTQKGALNKHERIHSGETPYVCPTCQKEFTEKGNLDKHMKTHSGEKPYSCPECNNCFTQKDSLSRHLRAHYDERPFLCLPCNKAFGKNSALHRHLRTITHRNQLISLNNAATELLGKVEISVNNDTPINNKIDDVRIKQESKDRSDVCDSSFSFEVPVLAHEIKIETLSTDDETPANVEHSA